MAKEIHTYPNDQRPDVEVLVDGAWYPGELRQWIDPEASLTLGRRLAANLADYCAPAFAHRPPESHRGSRDTCSLAAAMNASTSSRA
jgi:hypothetical protein